MSLGARLREARQAAKLTQRELGELCDWGKEAQSRASNYEKARREPTLADIIKWADITGSESGYLAFGSKKLPDDEMRILRTYRIATEKGKSFITNACEIVEGTPALQKKRK